MKIESEWVRPANRKDAARVQLLLGTEGLDPEFRAAEFVVAEIDGRIVGCVRARPLPAGGTELASLVVEKSHRGRGLARSLVSMALLGAQHPVFALTLVPDFAGRAGFEPIPASDLPQSLQAKVSACDAGGRAWLPMRLRRTAPLDPAPDAEGPPSFLDL